MWRRYSEFRRDRVAALLGLSHGDNRVHGRNIGTHDGSLSPELSDFIATHSDLMDAVSEENHTKPVLDLGAGGGNLSFMAASQSYNDRDILPVEIVLHRYNDLLAKCDAMANARLGLCIPSPQRGDFTSIGEMPEFDNALATRECLMWLNNAEECFSRQGDTQSRLEVRLRYCLEGSVVVSLDRLFRNDLFWHEEGFVTKVLRRDVSWRNNAIGADAKVDLFLYKYTKRDEPQPGVGSSRREEPAYKRLHFLQD